MCNACLYLASAIYHPKGPGVLENISIVSRDHDRGGLR